MSLGYAHPDFMMERLDARQLAELEAFWFAEGGWGEMKQDFRFGQLCSIHANINRDAKKRTRPYTAEDFALRPQVAPRATRHAEKRIRASLDMWAGVRAKKRPNKGRRG